MIKVGLEYKQNIYTGGIKMKEKQIDRLLRLTDENLADTIRHQIKTLENVKIYETENYMIYSIGVESTDAHLNGALCFNDDYAEEMLNKADDFFKDLGLDFSVWVRDHADFKLEKLLKARGLNPSREPGSAVMVIEDRITEVDLPEGYRVKGVNNRKEIDDFATVVKEAFDKTQPEIDKMYETDETIIAENVISFIIYKDDQPVGAVLTIVSDEVAGIYWVGVVEEARGQGIGSFLTQISTNSGFDSGKDLVVLQASEAGERVYTKLGYQTITRYRTYTIEKQDK